MNLSANWQNPITAQPGQFQSNVDPRQLLPSRGDLERSRLDEQQKLLDAGTERTTPIEVTSDGVIWDGHHAVRIAAENRVAITVKVVYIRAKPSAPSILDLKVS